MKSLLFGGLATGPLSAHLTLALLRVVTGLSIAFAHGVEKLPPPAGFVKVVSALGLPLPSAFAWAAGLSEFVGGILLAIGLMTRPAAALILLTMATAAFGYHGDDPFNVRELSILYGSVALAFAGIGCGRFGLDRIVNRN